MLVGLTLPEDVRFIIIMSFLTRKILHMIAVSLVITASRDISLIIKLMNLIVFIIVEGMVAQQEITFYNRMEIITVSHVIVILSHAVVPIIANPVIVDVVVNIQE